MVRILKRACCLTAAAVHQQQRQCEGTQRNL